MMPLLRKEIRVASWYALAVLAAFLLTGAQVVPYDAGFLWMGIGLAVGLTLLVPTIEWRLDTDRLIASLPVDRADVVRARYIVAIVAVPLALVVWTLWGRLWLPLLDPERNEPARWATFEGGLTFVLLAGLNLAALLPLHFALGLGRGATAFAAGWLGVGLVVTAATGAARDPVGAMAGAVGWLRGTVGSPWAVVVMLGGLGVVLALSAWVGTRAYARRDL